MWNVDPPGLAERARTLEIPPDLPTAEVSFPVRIGDDVYDVQLVGVRVAEPPADARGYLELEDGYLQGWGAALTRAGSTLLGFVNWNRRDAARREPALGVFGLEAARSDAEVLGFYRALRGAAGINARGPKAATRRETRGRLLAALQRMVEAGRVDHPPGRHDLAGELGVTAKRVDQLLDRAEYRMPDIHALFWRLVRPSG